MIRPSDKGQSQGGHAMDLFTASAVTLMQLHLAVIRWIKKKKKKKGCSPHGLDRNWLEDMNPAHC